MLIQLLLFSTFTAGAAALVKHLQTCGIPLAVATGSSLHTYQLKVSAHSDVFSCFHHVVCSDDSEVKNGKPSPDIYLTAAKRFSILPQSSNHVRMFIHTFVSFTCTCVSHRLCAPNLQHTDVRTCPRVHKLNNNLLGKWE